MVPVLVLESSSINFSNFSLAKYEDNSILLPQVYIPAFHLYLFEFPANAVVAEVGVGVGGCLKMQESFLVHFGQNLQMVEDVPVGTELP